MIEITNLTKFKLDKKPLQKAARAAFAVLGREFDVSLVLVGDDKMKAVNRIYRQKNRVTDVLSFEKINEIFICLPQAKRQASKAKIPLNCELTRLLVHGIVHLKGYDHEKGPKEAARMLVVENKILKK